MLLAWLPAYAVCHSGAAVAFLPRQSVEGSLNSVSPQPIVQPTANRLNVECCSPGLHSVLHVHPAGVLRCDARLDTTIRDRVLLLSCAPHDVDSRGVAPAMTAKAALLHSDRVGPYPDCLQSTRERGFTHTTPTEAYRRPISHNLQADRCVQALRVVVLPHPGSQGTIGSDAGWQNGNAWQASPRSGPSL